MKSILIAFACLLLIGNPSAASLPINCTNVDAGTPISVNGSAGFSINGVNQIVWTLCQPSLTLNYTNQTDYTINNATSQVPSEVDVGTGTSFNATTIWSSAGAWGVYHFNENGTIIDSAGNNNLARSDACLISITKNVSIGFGNIGQWSGCSAWKKWDKTGSIGGNFPVGNNNSTETYFLIETNTANADEVYIGSSAPAAGNYRQGLGETTYGNGWVYAGFNTDQTAYNVISNNAATYLSTSWDGSNKSIYVNGSLANSSAKTAPNTVAGEIWIGGTVGYVDEVRFYNPHKNATFINQTYQNFLGTAGFGMLGANGTALAPPTINSVSIFNNTAATGTTFVPNNALMGFANVTDNSTFNISGKWYVNGTANRTFTWNSYPNNTLTNADNTTAVWAMEGQTWVLEITAVGTGGNTSLNSSTITIDDPFLLIACQNISTTGTYTLQNNIGVPVGSCFNITASGITLDLGGYRINQTTSCFEGGSSPCAGVTAIGAIANTVIRNGRIDGFADVIRTFDEATLTSGVTSNNLTINNISGYTNTATCGSGGETGLAIKGVNTLTITNNNINASCDTVMLDDNTNGATRNVNLSNNNFEEKSGGSIEYGISLYASSSGGTYKVENVSITNNTFYVSGGANACVGLKYANNITFLNNTFRCDTWVTSAVGTLTNIFFNNSNSGNHYQLKNGREASDKYAITTTTPPNWATGGTPLPFTSGSPVEWAGTNTGSDYYPWTLNATLNTAPTILNNITFVNATETSSFTANASVQDLDGASDITSTSCSASSGTCTYVSNSTSANNFTVRYNLTGTGLNSANVNITFNDSFGGSVTTPNRTNSYPFSTANGSLVQTLATVGNIVKWQINYTINGTGTCTYTIPLSAIQNNSTIVNSTSDAMTNNGNYTDLSWNCNYSADPYLLTFYTENISQSADEAVSYTIQGTVQNRILLSSLFGQNVNFTFTYTLPAEAISAYLYLCGEVSNSSCISGGSWSAQTFSLVSLVITKTLEHTTNETVIIVSYSGSTGGSGGAGLFTAPPSNQTNQTGNQSVSTTPIIDGNVLEPYVRIADGYLRDRTAGIPNSLIGMFLFGALVYYDMKPKKNGKGAGILTVVGGLGVILIFTTYGGTL